MWPFSDIMMTHQLCNVYQPQGKVMFSQASVCSHGGRVSLFPCPFQGVGYL